MSPPLHPLVALGIAALGGFAIGLEREWEAHGKERSPLRPGIRTSTLLGLIGGIAGVAWGDGYLGVAAILLAAASALLVAAFVISRPHGMTTYFAAVLALGAGTLAGLDHLSLAAAIVAFTSLILFEKTWIHAFAKKIDDAEMRAGIRFAVMAVVILPLLPKGPFGPLGGVRPRELWALTLAFSGISFAGYVLRRVLGERFGYPVVGAVGGLFSSTGVTLVFARESQKDRYSARTLAAGAIAASTVLLARSLVVVTLLSPPVGLALTPLVAGPFVIGVLFVAVLSRRGGEKPHPPPETKNPLKVLQALELATVFQLVLFATHFVMQRWGAYGLEWAGAILGFADMDALLLSMSKAASSGGAPAQTAARAIALGIMSNAVLKLVIALALGRADYRKLAPIGLLVLSLASAASLIVIR
jgi:uncharacterized membrane protein (DUF4010 family)